jgi:translocation protein SEC62
MAAPNGGIPPLQPGQQPTPEQIRAIQEQLARDAAANGMSVQEFVEKLKAQHMAQQQAMAQQQQQQQGQPQGQQQNEPQPIQPGPPNPAAIAVAKFLKSQDLKQRMCILNGQRKDMFKGNLSTQLCAHF